MALIVRNLADEIIRRSVRKNWTGQFINGKLQIYHPKMKLFPTLIWPPIV
jgi:hypothetical protein